MDCAAPLSDRDILVALYNATDGPNWTDNTNWLSDEPIGNWRGVTTDSDGRVTKLWLYANNLTGTIPPELGSLANLYNLSLSTNNLTGTIPPELGSLANLENLYLSANKLVGAIPPELGGLANLEELYLGENSLTGVIPPEFAGLANLELLWLHANDLTGAIPPVLGGLDALRGPWCEQQPPPFRPAATGARRFAAFMVPISRHGLVRPRGCLVPLMVGIHSEPQRHGRGLRRPSVGPRHSRDAVQRHRRS